ncbi:hypothetical protein [Actinokineospora sp. NPDC004072]
MRTGRTAARRLFARALLVLGGAAAAWALGTATAAADTGADLVPDLGAIVESAADPAAGADLVERALTALPVQDGAKVAVEQVDEVGATVAEHFGHAKPGQPVEDLLPDLPALSPLPDPGAADGPLAVAPEPGRPLAVPAAAAQRHGESGARAAVAAAAEPAPAPRREQSAAPSAQTGTPDTDTPATPLSLPAPAQSGHPGAAGTGDTPQSGLLSTAPLATEPALAHTANAARASVPAAVAAQPGVTPD